MRGINMAIHNKAKRCVNLINGHCKYFIPEMFGLCLCHTYRNAFYLSRRGCPGYLNKKLFIKDGV